MYNTKLVEVDKAKRTVKVLNKASKKETTMDFVLLFSQMITKQDAAITSAGLTTESNKLIDVHAELLQHNKYDNIFGFGYGSNLSTTQSHLAIYSQLNVVRNNLLKNLEGSYMNALYDGYTKFPLHLARDKLAYVQHFYAGKNPKKSFVQNSKPCIQSLRFFNYNYLNPLVTSLYSKFLIWGPPSYLTQKCYAPLASTPLN